jgi:Domain of unknown function (DUF5710)
MGDDGTTQNRVLLDVEYEEREWAKRLGAKWDPVIRTWYVDTPAAWMRLSDRALEYAVIPWPQREWLPNTYAERDAAKAMGAKFDTEWKSWYMP